MSTAPLPPGTIVVRGGEGPKLPPIEREIDGTPDPALARMVAEGASRYHLDTLRSLDAEDRDTAKAIEETRRAVVEAPRGGLVAGPAMNRRARRAAARAGRR